MVMQLHSDLKLPTQNIEQAIRNNWSAQP